MQQCVEVVGNDLLNKVFSEEEFFELGVAAEVEGEVAVHGKGVGWSEKKKKRKKKRKIEKILRHTHKKKKKLHTN